ncbi:hypothetical protein FACS189437_02550 [Bacteroidia bacterium]|nr:hypothetical protein FACS189437_02550 [Bacteroidia bacterium]
MEENTSFRELAPGTTLLNGTYTIERTIGAGGFGITYYAKHTGLNSYYVIKEFFLDGHCVRNTQAKTIILQGIDEDAFQKYRQKFIEEAQMLARLDHPNIVKVMNVFDENNTSYMVMPFVEGKTLQQVVEKQGKLNYDMAVNYIAQLADAVGHIHQKDILHRDIKPDNIIITLKNTVVLIDFGSAREFVHDKTQSHTTMLTQGYAPLEQYSSNSRKGAYSDIYAIGATLYFATTGQKPLDATSRTMEILPEPCELNPDISEDANRTIMKAMQMKAENRHQSIQEFMDDLLGTHPSEPIVEKSGIKSIDKKILIGIMATVIVIALSVFFVVSNQSNKEKKILLAEQTEIRVQAQAVTDSIMLSTVYWDNTGQNYHLFHNCNTLSTTIAEGAVNKAFENNKKQCCEVCKANVAMYKDGRMQAKHFYDVAVDMQNDGYFNIALDYCNSVLAMRPDNEKINELKQQIESRR